MGLSDDLRAQVGKITKESWTRREARTVPNPESVKYNNDGVDLDAACLYADLSDSTILVSNASPTVAAEVFRAYLYCAAKIISSEGESITAYDGDRVMAVYIGDDKSTRAVTSAFQIHHALETIIKPAFQHKQLGGYQIGHGIGIDTGKIFAARAGFRTADDLVWIGPAANFAAKLSAIRKDGYPIWITDAAYKAMNVVFQRSPNGTPLWEAAQVAGVPKQVAYRSRVWASV